MGVSFMGEVPLKTLVSLRVRRKGCERPVGVRTIRPHGCRQLRVRLAVPSLFTGRGACQVSSRSFLWVINEEKKEKNEKKKNNKNKNKKEEKKQKEKKKGKKKEEEEKKTCSTYDRGSCGVGGYSGRSTNPYSPPPLSSSNNRLPLASRRAIGDPPPAQGSCVVSPQGSLAGAPHESTPSERPRRV